MTQEPDRQLPADDGTDDVMLANSPPLLETDSGRLTLR
jgi:hypothetical protein